MEKIKTENGSKGGETTNVMNYHINIPALNPNGSDVFKFYLYNQSEYFVQAVLVDDISLERLENNARVKFKLKSLSDLMSHMYFPPVN